MAIRIMLVDDHNMIRAGFRSMIEKHANMEVVGEAADGQSAVQTARSTSPDVIVIDIGMPGLNGIEATRRIMSLKPCPRVIGLSMHSDRRYVTRMLKAGASGYVLKNSVFEELVEAIETVAKGGIFLSPQVAGTIVADLKREAKDDDDGSVFSVLTARERDVLLKISNGCPAREIASSLGLSVKTVDTHRRQIMDKLNLHSVAELTKYAIKEGLIPLDR